MACGTEALLTAPGAFDQHPDQAGHLTIGANHGSSQKPIIMIHREDGPLWAGDDFLLPVTVQGYSTVACGFNQA